MESASERLPILHELKTSKEYQVNSFFIVDEYRSNPSDLSESMFKGFWLKLAVSDIMIAY